MERTRLIVFMDGGRVDHLVSDHPLEVVIIDLDTEGLEEDEISNVFGDEVYAVDNSEHVELNRQLIEDYFQEIRLN